MKKMLLKKALLLTLVLFLPTLVYAGVFSVAPTDKSMEYLGMVFGPVGSLPITAQGNAQFSKLIYLFNQIVFALGIVIIIFTSFVGVINTAQEGEVMGKKWSSVIIPFRAGLGVYLLLPSSTGYNWIQIIVMWLIVQGVGAANALWTQVITSLQTQGGIEATPTPASLSNAYSAVNAIFTSTVCMQAINNNASALTALNEPIVVTQYGNSIRFGRASNVTETPPCGSVQVPTITGSLLNSGTDTNTAQRSAMMAQAILLAQSTLQPSAQEAISTPSANWSLMSNFTIAANSLNAAAAQLSSTFQGLNQVNQNAITDGWILAGSYYFQIAAQGLTSGVNVNISSTAFDPTVLQTLLGNTLSTSIIATITTDGGTYAETALNNIQAATASSSGGGGQMSINVPSAGKGPIQAVIDQVFGSVFIDLAAKIGAMITTNQGDPLISIATFGGNLATAIELLFWGAMFSIFMTWLGTSTLSCIQPLGHTMDYILMIAMPIVSICIMMLWATGISLALYVPLIPYLVFTFGAIAWIILVIEAMLGAPLIALTLIVPSEDEIGKAGHGIVILLGLILRPALMILGFILGIKFLIVAIGMLNFAFAATLKASVSMSFGIFGFIAILMVYAGIAIALVHEAFSLIYLLPDKVLRWMGGGHEGADISGNVRKLEGSMDKGAGIGKGMMKGSLGTAQGMMKKGGGGGGGGGIGV